MQIFASAQLHLLPTASISAELAVAFDGTTELLSKKQFKNI
jgi:hypothetical protein